MDFGQIFQTLLAFIFVLGLMFLTLWLIKFCQQKGLNSKLARCLSCSKRIQISELQRLDPRNSVVILQCDNIEYLLLIGQGSATILNQHPIRSKVASK